MGNMLGDIIKKIESRWGEMTTENNCFYNGSPKYLKNKSHFNYIFKKIGLEKYCDFAKEHFFEMPQELIDFYQECNGIRLFLSSLSIYGFQVSTDTMQPFDLAIENYNIHARMSGNNCDNDALFFFGSYGGDYVFAYDINQSNEIYVYENGFNKPILSFESLKDLLCFFVDRMSIHYNEKCEKDKINVEFKKYPALAHSMYDINEIL